MGKLEDGWNKAKAQAEKVLGKDCEVPAMSGSIGKAVTGFNDNLKAFFAARDTLSDAMLNLDNANAGLLNALQQFRATIEKNNFNLDAKTEAKNIAQARKILLGSIDGEVDACKVVDKSLDDLTKHVTQLNKYTG